MHVAGVDEAPPITEAVSVIAFDVEPFGGVVLEDGDRVVTAFQEQLDSFGSEQRGIKAVEENRTSAPLRVPNLPCEDRLACRFPAAVELKIFVADHLHEPRAKRFGGAAEL